MSDGRANWSCQVDKRDGCARRRAPSPALCPSPALGQSARASAASVRVHSWSLVDKSRSDPGEPLTAGPDVPHPLLIFTFHSGSSTLGFLFGADGSPRLGRPVGPLRIPILS